MQLTDRSTAGACAPVRPGVTVPVAAPGAVGPAGCCTGAEDGVELELVIPAFNEETRIGATVLAMADRLEGLDVDAAIRVVDNGSTDRTAEAVDAVAASSPVPVALQACALQGKGAAVARGVVTSSARWVGFCDADLATPAEAVDDAVHYLRQGWPVVIGSRHAEGAQMAEHQPVLRRLGGGVFRRLARGVVGELSDTQCGFKFFDGEVARRIFARCTLEGFAFDVEVLAAAHELGLAVKELPVSWSHQEGSTFRPLRDGIAAARELWHLHRHGALHPHDEL